MENATVRISRTVVANGGTADLISHMEFEAKNMEISIQAGSNGEQIIILRPTSIPHGKPPAARPERYWIKKSWDLFFATIKTLIETALKILL